MPRTRGPDISSAAGVITIEGSHCGAIAASWTDIRRYGYPLRIGSCYVPLMRQHIESIVVATSGQGLYEVTRHLGSFVAASAIRTGLATIFVRHTSCSLLIQENADPDVQTDLHGFFRRLVPEGMDWLVHTTEGPDDMPAHIKAALTQTSIGIPVSDGRPVLGTWQGLYLFEHRARPHRRELVFHISGE